MSNLLKISLYGLYCQLLYFLTEDIHICLRCVNGNDPFGFQVWQANVKILKFWLYTYKASLNLFDVCCSKSAH